MEMEQQNTKAVAKKLWKVVGIVFYMMKTGMSKSKLMLDLNLILKRGNKAITSLHHRSRGGGADVIASLTCRSDADVISSAAVLREYEFSCSNSPANPFAHLCKRKRYRYRGGGGGYDETAVAAAAVQRVFKLLGESKNDEESPTPKVAGESPLAVFPAVRVTDSPFPAKEEGGDGNVVDKAAEEFIKRFYKNLKSQKKMAAATGLESPYYCGWDR